jgi:hypothetical protein
VENITHYNGIYVIDFDDVVGKIEDRSSKLESDGKKLGVRREERGERRNV